MRASADVSSRRSAGRYATSGSRKRRKDLGPPNSSSGSAFPTSSRHTDAGSTASPSHSSYWWTETTTASISVSTSSIPRAESATLLAETPASTFWCSCPRGESKLGSPTLEAKRSTRESPTILAWRGQETAGRTSTASPPCAGAMSSEHRLLPRSSPPARSTSDCPGRYREAEPISGSGQSSQCEPPTTVRRRRQSAVTPPARRVRTRSRAACSGTEFARRAPPAIRSRRAGRGSRRAPSRSGPRAGTGFRRG